MPAHVLLFRMGSINMNHKRNRFFASQAFRMKRNDVLCNSFFKFVLVFLQINNLFALIEQGPAKSKPYDVPDDLRFSDILLSPRAFPTTMKDVEPSSDSKREIELPLSPVKVSHQTLPPLPPRFKNVYGTKGAKKRWLAKQRALLEGASRLPDCDDDPVPVSSCSCVMCLPLEGLLGGMRRSSRTKKASTKFVENQESIVLQQLHDQQADAEMAMKKEADKTQQQRDREEAWRSGCRSWRFK